MVQYAIVKNFIKNVKEKALGQKVIESISAGQQFVKIVHDEMTSLLGEEEQEFRLHERPAKVLLCGLQGSGKTTHAAKLALYLKEKKGFKKPCLVACDLARPAAAEQLYTLAIQAGLDCFRIEGERNPLTIAREAISEAPKQMWDLLIFDTAGRLHIDETLMKELSQLKEYVKPQHTVLTLNAATGQDAVRSVSQFTDQIGITGSCLTMLDGSSRGGAAISVVEITKKPILFEGHGERLKEIRPFHPSSMADRILGMGDTINLVRTAQEHIKEEDAKLLQQKLRRAQFTYSDFLHQIHTIKNMGSVKQLLSMFPSIPGLQFDEGDTELESVEAIISSMTLEEKEGLCELTPSRRRRIAQGSGTSVKEVDRLVRTIKEATKFFKQAPKMKQLQKMMGGLWR